MKDKILLTAGLALTAAYVAAPAPLYEAIYYEREFSNEMYNEALYLPLALGTAALAWAAAAAYYYAINSVRFSRWYHWLLMLALVAGAGGGATLAYTESVFSALGYDFGTQIPVFSIVAGLAAGALYVAASFSLRWWSSNCRHTPFPE